MKLILTADLLVRRLNNDTVTTQYDMPASVVQKPYRLSGKYSFRHRHSSLQNKQIAPDIYTAYNKKTVDHEMPAEFHWSDLKPITLPAAVTGHAARCKATAPHFLMPTADAAYSVKRHG